ncbi:hypothetical protein C8J56DRAFT_970770, partial [Mycena floridula]
MPLTTIPVSNLCLGLPGTIAKDNALQTPKIDILLSSRSLRRPILIRTDGIRREVLDALCAKFSVVVMVFRFLVVLVALTPLFAANTKLEAKLALHFVHLCIGRQLGDLDSKVTVDEDCGRSFVLVLGKGHIARL